MLEKQLIIYISEKLSKDLKVGLTNANFYIFLRDGSTDAFITEKEAIFTIFTHWRRSYKNLHQLS